MDEQATLQLVPALRAPRAARAFVAETLTAWDIQAEEVDAVRSASYASLAAEPWD